MIIIIVVVAILIIIFIIVVILIIILAINSYYCWEFVLFSNYLNLPFVIQS